MSYISNSPRSTIHARLCYQLLFLSAVLCLYYTWGYDNRGLRGYISSYKVVGPGHSHCIYWSGIRRECVLVGLYGAAWHWFSLAERQQNKAQWQCKGGRTRGGRNVVRGAYNSVPEPMEQYSFFPPHCALNPTPAVKSRTKLDVSMPRTVWALCPLKRKNPGEDRLDTGLSE